MPVLRVKPKLFQNRVTNFFVVNQVEIKICRFFLNFLVIQKRPLEGVKFTPRNRRKQTAPQKIHKIQICALTFPIRLPCALVDVIKIIFTEIFFPVKNYFLESSVLIQRHVCMEKQISVMAGVHAAFLVKIIQMFLKLRTFHKIIFKFVNNFLFVLRQNVTVGRVNLNRRESCAVL